jgi:hypothetical protein
MLTISVCRKVFISYIILNSFITFISTFSYILNIYLTNHTLTFEVL